MASVHHRKHQCIVGQLPHYRWLHRATINDGAFYGEVVPEHGCLGLIRVQVTFESV